MPRFLLITILILVIAGHIFAIKEEDVNNQMATEQYQIAQIESLYFDEDFIEMNEPLQIIESPSLEEGEEGELLQVIFINNGDECIFFENGDIPKSDVCPTETQNTISTSEF